MTNEKLSESEESTRNFLTYLPLFDTFTFEDLDLLVNLLLAQRERFRVAEAGGEALREKVDDDEMD